MENGSSCVRDNDSERKGGRPTQLNETVFLQDEYSRLIASTNGTSSMTEPFKAADCSSSDAHPSASASASSVVGDAGQNMATNVSVDIARQSKNDQHRGAEAISPLPYNTSFSSSQACISTLMGARLNANKNLTSYYPQSERLCRRLSDTFFSNVEPVLCLFHKPTLRRAFNAHLAQQELYSSVLPRLSPSKPSRTDPFEPLLFSIFFSAIHSMDAIQVHDMFGVNKTDMLTRFEEAFMSALDNESFLSRPSIAVLQAFVLYLTCRCRDDEMQQIWALIGLIVRIAQSLGLDQEPTSLSSDAAIDAIDVEIRRRLWYQIFYLDVRTAVAQGLPPIITTGSFTTRLPSNVDDDDLMLGQPPLPDHYNPCKFTAMTVQLVRLHGVTSMQKLLYLVRRNNTAPDVNPNFFQPKDRQSASVSAAAAAEEEQNMRMLIETTLEKNQMLYLRYCDLRIPLHRFILHLSNHIKWKFWIYYQLQYPHSHDNPLAPAQKSLIFSQSLNLLESYIRMTEDAGLNPYRWMIDSHSNIHAASYVIAVLQDSQSNTTLDADLFQRGKSLLQSIQHSGAYKESQVGSVLYQMVNNLDNSVPAPAEPGHATGDQLDATLIHDMGVPNLDDWTSYLNDIM